MIARRFQPCYYCRDWRRGPVYNNMKVIDAHVHFSMQTGADFLAGFLSETATDMACICTVPHSRAVTLTPAALVMKHRYKGRFYVFASLDAAGYFLHGHDLGAHMVEYVKKQRAMGCDGIKLLEGKPQMRKLLPVPDFDHALWEPFWAYAEESSLPILMHLNDPESFWSADAPAMAKAQGWFYDDSYVNNEAQYAQMLNVLSRHPKLKIIFAHFFFMSAQLPRLAAILDSFPNVMVDMTPGIEMYENFSAHIETAREFFAKYKDRIIYGTDIGGRCVLSGEDKPFDRAENLRRPQIVRRFISMDGEEIISSDGHFLVSRGDFLMGGLGLKEPQAALLLGENFRRFTGESAPVDAAAVLRFCAELRESFAQMSEKYPAYTPDTSCVELAEAYFSEKIGE